MSLSNAEEGIKTNFWQRLYTRNQNKQPSETVSLRGLVRENHITPCRIKTSSIFQFRFATLTDVCFLILATIASLILGVTIPLSMVIFGDSIDSFTDRATDLCSLNLTSLGQLYCPPNVTLTLANFYTSMS